MLYTAAWFLHSYVEGRDGDFRKFLRKWFACCHGEWREERWCHPPCLLSVFMESAWEKREEKKQRAHYSNSKFPLKTSHIPFVLLEISLNPSRLTSPCSLWKMSVFSKESLIKGGSYWSSTAVHSSPRRSQSRPRCDQTRLPTDLAVLASAAVVHLLMSLRLHLSPPRKIHYI